MSTGFLWFCGVCLVMALLTSREYPVVAGAFFTCIVIAAVWSM